MPQPSTKPCRKCGETKPLEAFYKKPLNRDGRAHVCNTCQSAHRRNRRANDPELAERQRQLLRESRERHGGHAKYEANRKVKMEADPEYRARRLETHRRCDKAYNERTNYNWHYYQENKERLKEDCRKRYQQYMSDPCRRQELAEMGRERSRRWRDAKPDMARACAQRRRARKIELPDTLTSEDVAAATKAFGNACATCRIPFGIFQQRNLDHWVPITDPTCPGTVPSNMVPLCEHCNKSKANRPAAEWATDRFGDDASAILRRIETYLKSQPVPPPAR